MSKHKTRTKVREVQVVEVEVFDILGLVVTGEPDGVTLATYAEWIGELDEDDIESFLDEVYGERDEDGVEEVREALVEFLEKYFGEEDDEDGDDDDDDEDEDEDEGGQGEA